MHPGMAARERVMTDTTHITAPPLLHVQRDDEIFPREGQVELFDLIGSLTKYLVTEASPHTHTTPAAIADWPAFIAEHLTDRSQESRITIRQDRVSGHAEISALTRFALTAPRLLG
jgi:hypothetical protein